MKEEFARYLDQLGMAQPFQNRIQEIVDFYEKYCSKGIADIFVSEYVDSDGKRQFENLWVFDDECFYEAKEFLTRDVYDLLRIKNRIEYWEMDKTEYDFEKASEKSRMSITVQTSYPTGGYFKASQENCDALRDIFVKHFIPNLRK